MMSTLTYEIRPDGLYIRSAAGWLALTPYTPRAIRVRYTLKPDFSARRSLIVVSEPEADVRFTVEETPDSLVFATSEMSIEISRQTAAFTYRNHQGYLLTREPTSGGKTLEPIEVAVSVFDDATMIEDEKAVDGVRIRAGNVRKVVDRQAYHTKLAFEWADGEALYGLGSHEEGMLNLRGQHQYLYQENMKAVVPVLVSTQGYGILLDSASLMTFHDDAFGSYLWTDVADELDYYFVYGPELDQIVHELRCLTGKAPMLPKWAFGYVQSKERYTSQEELLGVVQEYRARGLPLDCIVLDWKSWTGESVGPEDAGPGALPRSATDDGRSARLACQADGFHLADHATGRRELAGDARAGLPAGESGHLRRVQPGGARVLLEPGRRRPLLPGDRRLVVRLHRAVRGGLAGRGEARTGRTVADQHRRGQTLP